MTKVLVAISISGHISHQFVYYLVLTVVGDIMTGDFSVVFRASRRICFVRKRDYTSDSMHGSRLKNMFQLKSRTK